MGELIPVLNDKGEIEKYVSYGADFTYYEMPGTIDVYLWRGEIGYKISADNEIFNDLKDFSLERLLDRTKNFPVYTFNDISELAKNMVPFIKDKLNGKKVIHSFSGGKDSIASLYLLLKLMEHINFKLDIVYVYVPYLESLLTHKFLDDVERRLGVDILRVEADRKKMLYSLNKYGMPMRGFRWCTYLKIRAIRDIKKRGNYDLEVKGDRASESYKRFKTLVEYAKQRMFISGKQFKPIFFMTLFDVVKLVRDIGLVHPHYLKGCPRVACDLCPYKNIFGFFSSDVNIEDPGLIDQYIRRSYNRGYSMDYESYTRYILWRFHPDLARIIFEIGEMLERKNSKFLMVDYIVRDFNSVWKKQLPKLDLVDFTEMFEIILKASKIEKLGLIELRKLKNKE